MKLLILCATLGGAVPPLPMGWWRAQGNDKRAAGGNPCTNSSVLGHLPPQVRNRVPRSIGPGGGQDLHRLLAQGRRLGPPWSMKTATRA
jgi:hypothetical protein